MVAVRPGVGENYGVQRQGGTRLGNSELNHALQGCVAKVRRGLQRLLPWFAGVPRLAGINPSASIEEFRQLL
jgi:hypothetical protein